MTKYPEDSLTLLGDDVTKTEPDAYYRRISAMYTEHRRSVKTPKPIAIKGKISKKASKKRPGEFALTYGPLTHTITHTTDRRLSGEALIAAIEALTCDRERLCTFLTSKKFSVDGIQSHE